MAACPCCKQPLPELPLQWSLATRTVLRDGKAVKLAPQAARIFDVIYRAHPEKITYSAVLERAYAHDPDGGPESTNVISVFTNIIRKKLKPLGVSVGRVKGTRGDLGLEIGA